LGINRRRRSVNVATPTAINVGHQAKECMSQTPVRAKRLMPLPVEQLAIQIDSKVK
jgi:hypothetical protein